MITKLTAVITRKQGRRRDGGGGIMTCVSEVLATTVARCPPLRSFPFFGGISPSKLEKSDEQKWSPRLCSESKLCGVRRTNNHSSSDRNKRGDAKPECPSDPDHGGVHARKRKERTISESDKHETKCCRPSTINNSDSSAISWSDDDSACDFTDRFEKCGRGRERLEESAADDAEEKASHEDAAASTADEGEDGDEEKNGDGEEEREGQTDADIPPRQGRDLCGKRC